MSELPKFNNRGVKWTLELKQGASFKSQRFVLYQPNGTPKDLTGCEIRGQIRRDTAATAVAAVFTVTLPANLAEGWFELSLSDEVTAAMAAGLSLKDPASQYVHDVELEDAAGDVSELLYGPVYLFAEATKPTP